MPSIPVTTRYLRLSTICLIFLAIIVWIGPFLDWQSGEVQRVLGGRINNLSMAVAIIYVFMLLPLPRAMRSPRERAILLSAGTLLLYAVLISYARYANWLVTFGGLVSLFGAISAGLGAYALGKAGKGIHLRIVVAMLATVPALSFPVLMIALDPEAFKAFWINVYGYGNIRGFGYFSSAAIVLLCGLLPVSLKQGKPALLALHFGALSFSWSMLFWSGSRAGMLAVGLAIILGWLIFWRHTIKEILLAFIAGATGGRTFNALSYTRKMVWSDQPGSEHHRKPFYRRPFQGQRQPVRHVAMGN